MDNEISLPFIRWHLFLQFQDYGVDSLALSKHEELYSIHRRSIITLCIVADFLQINGLNVTNKFSEYC